MAAQLVVGSLLFAILASSSGNQSAMPDFRREDENVLRLVLDRLIFPELAKFGRRTPAPILLVEDQTTPLDATGKIPDRWQRATASVSAPHARGKPRVKVYPMDDDRLCYKGDGEANRHGDIEPLDSAGLGERRRLRCRVSAERCFDRCSKSDHRPWGIPSRAFPGVRSAGKRGQLLGAIATHRDHVVGLAPEAISVGLPTAQRRVR